MQFVLLPVFLIPTLLIWFVVLWIFIMWVAATVGGWRRLAAKYASTVPAAGEIRWFHRQSMSMGLSNYGGCTSIGVAPQGLYLGIRPKLIFPFHPWLLLPWSDLEVVRIREGWLLKQVILHAGKPAVSRLELPFKVLEAAEQLKSRLDAASSPRRA